jgi:peptidoglycan endopeptidase LytE
MYCVQLLKFRWLMSTALVFALFLTGATEAFASQHTRVDRIINDGEDYYRTPYKFGASTSTTRVFDCSSFTKRIFAENGIYLPRDSRQQSTMGKKVSRFSDIRKGDLLFFDTNRDRRIDHVSLYTGKGKLLHTYGKPGVVYSTITRTNYWGKTFVEARRVR